MKLGNLLIIANSYPNSEGTYNGNIFVKEQINYIKNHFNKVYVVSPTPYGLEWLRKTRHGNYKYDNVEVYFPKYLNIPIFYKYGRHFWIALATKAIERIIKNNRIICNLIHAQGTWPAGSIGVNIGKKLNCPVIITEHTSKTVEQASRTKDRLFIKTWEQCAALIRVRHGDEHLFTSVGISPEKIQCIPLGYDPLKFHPLNKTDCRNNLTLGDNNKIILNVANLYSHVKGHKYLIEAMAKVSNHRKDVVCVIVGDGKLKTEIEKQISKYKLQGFVKLVGAKPHKEIPTWMNACDIFILPSLNEGNPTVLVESLGTGTPYVGTNVGGIPGIITSEEYGLLCKPADSDALAAAILLGIEKKWDHDKILSHSSRFTWDNIANEVVKVYQKIAVRHSNQ